MGDWKLERGAASPAAESLLARCRPFLDAPHAAVEESDDAEILKEGTRMILRVPEAGVLKIVKPRSIRRALSWLFMPSRLAEEFDTTDAAARNGLPVPRPLLVAEQRAWGLRRGVALLCEGLPDVITLDQFIRGACPPPGRLRKYGDDVCALLRDLGTLVGRLHCAGGIHGDLHPHNILVTAEPPRRLFLVDWPYGFFLGQVRPPSRLRQRLALRRAARHCNVSVAELRAAIRAWGRGEGCSPTFRAIQQVDLVKLAEGLVRSGTPFRPLLHCVRAYMAQVGAAADEQRQVIAALAGACVARLEKHIRRILRAAADGTRGITVRREGQGQWCLRRGYELGEVRDAVAAAEAAGRLEVLRQLPDVRTIWRVGCAVAYAALPIRTLAACFLGDREGSDVLVLERPQVPLERARLRGDVDVARLASFVRLYHTFGFRFRRFDGDTLRRQPAEAGPVGFRQGCGYLLHDVAAVSFEPGTPTGDSAGQVAAWVREACGVAQTDELRARCSRRLLFSL